MFQTGLDPAVVGFYRAVAERLGAAADLAVLPQFYRRNRPYEPGKPWRPE
jgi:hypothetical protein